MDEMCASVTDELKKNINKVPSVIEKDARTIAKILSESPLSLLERRLILAEIKEKTNHDTRQKSSNNNKPLQVAYRYQNFFRLEDWTALKDKSKPDSFKCIIVSSRALKGGTHIWIVWKRDDGYKKCFSITSM